MAEKQPKNPALEWIAAAVGAAIAIGLIVVIGWDAVTGPVSAPPAIVVRAERIVPTRAGFVVEVEARNLADSTAAGVEIEGSIQGGSDGSETSRATIDYVPGHARRHAGLIFARDPRGRPLELRALGYQEP